MAGKSGGSSADLTSSDHPEISSELEQALLKESPSFSFFQTVRLLRLMGMQRGKEAIIDYSLKEKVRLRPHLSLGFPPADVEKIEKNDDSLYHIFFNFLGLYGVSSPLPTFYTEDLLDEATEDNSVARDFLDIFNHRIYELFFQCMIKYRQSVQVVEEGNDAFTQRLFSLVGLSEERLREDIPTPLSLLRYIGLLTQYPRSSVGLKSLIGDTLGNVPVDVLPCILRLVKIPVDQRICMGVYGGNLGMDSYLGEEIEDKNGKFRIKIGPMNKKYFQDCFPGGDAYERIVLLTNLYVNDPLEYDMELILRKGEKQTVALGDSEWSCLGMNTWVFSGEDQWESRSVVSPPD